ncbi:MAG: NAD-dependent epimerase/dehydratase family protein [Acidisphaera sp.]|nr:NAD-dependent epimerase/dehydratase family protein [Acidisphaera sp.]
MAILVTGAGGHLGANLVRHLLAEGETVRALLHDPVEAPSLAGLSVETLVGDLRDPALAAACVAGCTQVYHCAARVSTSERGRDEIFGCNVLATRILLQAARAARVGKVVVTSSFSAVGVREDGIPSDETVPFNPFERHLPYEQSKAAAEHECLKACADGLPVVIATSTAILGPNDFKPSRMGRVLIDFAHGRLPAYIQGGFEFVAACDIAAGHRLAMAKGRPGQKYIFSTGFVNMDEMMAMFRRVTGRPHRPLRLPPTLMRVAASVTARLSPLVAPRAEPLLTPAAIRLLRLARRADTSKARTELGFRPTSIEAAVADAYRDFVDRGVIVRDARPRRSSSPKPCRPTGHPAPPRPV